ncbi:uncharacterized protein BX664DRAFT_340305 [Halteromyces radiatus]|uniref:uncharacterized protein n=1 Tax=Halteromyces radiatus TaxID=101107 RepID=UPI00222091EC|nr:uncharacterized protein BX664DRAFT_340305 [Halteromyces radiatus]KAI8081395.1 hypothetical protein BX664DRAFT_340305 [Halteromyces radiatus]
MLPPNFNTRNSRPVSEILKPGNYTSSSENDSLNLWYEDLQQYERNLDEMAAASLDQNFKEEMQHVDQWFRFLSEAERTATIYTLLQHSSQVQVRFFINLLQQMGKRDSMHSILMTPNPDQSDMQSQFAGALAKAEMEASQRLMSVLPYKTGQVVSRPPPSTARRQVDRHSFALGDTEDYSRQFVGNGSNNRFNEATRLGGSSGGSSGGSGTGAGGRPTSQNFSANTLLTPGANPFHGGTGGSRPRSVIEGDTSTLFSTPWSTPASSAAPSSSRRPMSVVGNIGDRNGSGLGLERPKSADVTNWSFTGMEPMVDQQRVTSASGNTSSNVNGAFPSPWNLGLDSDIDFNALTLQPYRRGNNTSNVRGGAGTTTSASAMRNIPGTLSEKDEQQQSLKPPTISRPTSPRPASSSSTPFNHRKHLVPPGMEKQFGQFLNPSDHLMSGSSLDPNSINEHDYHSDHSEASNVSSRRVSTTTTTTTTTTHPRGSALTSSSNMSPSSNLNTAVSKEKKSGEIIDMDLLQDVPAWFRSLRLHKYNSIFEPMKWQDIIKLTDSDLEAKGVAALGARRKMLKVFENVKTHCDENNIEY